MELQEKSLTLSFVLAGVDINEVASTITSRVVDVEGCMCGVS